METIEGRVALVTGGGRGIGRAIALALARAGAHVAVAARSVPEIEAVAGEVKQLGRRAFFFPLDVSDRAQLAGAPAQVARALGAIDILVNNAGLHASTPLLKQDDATWDAVLAVNLTAPMLLSRACLPHLYQQGWGRIINVASVAGKIGLKYGSAYAASKHGLIGLMRTVAKEAAARRIRVNVVAPGPIATTTSSATSRAGSARRWAPTRASFSIR
jgi:meso-butanediol dehydrogenase / (S,S)-butanediol dehydrogenase / diacetyl reductase